MIIQICLFDNQQSQGNYICDFKVDGRVIKQLVIRFYDENPGKNTVLTISEEAETIVAFMLHSTHMAPKVHTVFKNGRIEEFVPVTE